MRKVASSEPIQITLPLGAGEALKDTSVSLPLAKDEKRMVSVSA